MKNMFPDSEICKQTTCARTKCTSIINNVTGQYGLEQVVSCLQKNKFSLLVDESTDVSAVKHLAIVVRYLNGEEIVDRFPALIPVPDCTDNNLYKVVTEFFENNKIPRKENLIGYSSDGANNVSGAYHSLGALLEKDIKHLFRIKCICHSWNKCASNACKILSQAAESFVRNVHHYFTHSYERR